MSYVSLARKYRPRRFVDMVGQESTTLALTNAIRLRREPHSVIFTGVRGIGKTTSARIYAKALNCELGPTAEPCDVCASCHAITVGNHEDVLEIDGASNTGVDDVRALQETLSYVPQRSTYKIYIIDEVHMLSISAFNALLKTLEEPPQHVVFIFATTELHKVPETIQSRCQVFHLQKISRPVIAERIRSILNAEQIPFDEAALAVIAREGRGSMRDALTLLDQAIAVGGGQVSLDTLKNMVGGRQALPVLELLDGLLRKDATLILEVIARWDQEGLAMAMLVEETAKACRNAFILRDLKGQAIDLQILELEDREQQMLLELGEKALPMDLNRLFRLLAKCLDDLRHADLDRFILENYCLEWCFDPGLPDLQTMMNVVSGGQVLPQSAPRPVPQSSAESAVNLRERWKTSAPAVKSPGSPPAQPVHAAPQAPQAKPAADNKRPWMSSAPGAQPPQQGLNPNAVAQPALSNSYVQSTQQPLSHANNSVQQAAPSSNDYAHQPRSDGFAKHTQAVSNQNSVVQTEQRLTPNSNNPQPTLNPTGSVQPTQKLPPHDFIQQAISNQNSPQGFAQSAPNASVQGQPSVTQPSAGMTRPSASEQADREQQAMAAPSPSPATGSKGGVAVGLKAGLQTMQAATVAAQSSSARVPVAQSAMPKTSQASQQPMRVGAAAWEDDSEEMPSWALAASLEQEVTQVEEPAPKPAQEPVKQESFLQQMARRAASNTPVAPKVETPTPTAVEAAPACDPIWPDNWRAFVDEWKKQKPLQGRVLEEAYVLEYTPQKIRLAVEPQSMAGGKLLQQDVRKRLMEQFAQLFGFQGVLEAIPKGDTSVNTETILEVKHREKEIAREQLRHRVEDHPMTREVISRFGGTIEQIELQ